MKLRVKVQIVMSPQEAGISYNMMKRIPSSTLEEMERKHIANLDNFGDQAHKILDLVGQVNGEL